MMAFDKCYRMHDMLSADMHHNNNLLIQFGVFQESQGLIELQKNKNNI